MIPKTALESRNRALPDGHVTNSLRRSSYWNMKYLIRSPAKIIIKKARTIREEIRYASNCYIVSLLTKAASTRCGYCKMPALFFWACYGLKEDRKQKTQQRTCTQHDLTRIGRIKQHAKDTIKDQHSHCTLLESKFREHCLHERLMNEIKIFNVPWLNGLLARKKLLKLVKMSIDFVSHWNLIERVWLMMKMY